MSAAAYRARSATELIDATFQLLRRNAAAFYTLSAMFTIPNAILQALFMRPAIVSTTQTLGAGAAGGLGGFFGYYVCALALGALFHTAMMILASDAYLGRPAVVADGIKQATSKWLMIFLAFIVTSVLVGLAFFALIVPGFYVALVLFAVPPVIIFENTDIGTAMSRSSTLSKGLKGHIFLTLLLAGLIYIVGLVIVIIVAAMLIAISPYAQIIVQALGLTLIVPIFPIVAVLIYYDARIRKEGFDIELMAQQVGGAAAAKPQPA